MSKKVALVTGAGKGIGAAVAHKLAQDGFIVGVFSPSENAERIATAIEGFSLRGTLMNNNDIAHFVQLAVQRYGRIDVLFNGAGHAAKGTLLEITDEQWISGFEMVFLSIVRTTRFVTPVMQNGGGGAIVNLSSYASLEPEADFPLTTVRAAVNAWTKLYASTYAKDNIRMNSVLPGFTDSLPEKEARRQRVPMGRYASTAEIAATAAFLLSDAASYITGQNIRVDGGLSHFAG